MVRPAKLESEALERINWRRLTRRASTKFKEERCQRLNLLRVNNDICHNSNNGVLVLLNYTGLCVSRRGLQNHLRQGPPMRPWDDHFLRTRHWFLLSCIYIRTHTHTHTHICIYIHTQEAEKRNERIIITVLIMQIRKLCSQCYQPTWLSSLISGVSKSLINAFLHVTAEFHHTKNCCP